MERVDGWTRMDMQLKLTASHVAIAGAMTIITTTRRALMFPSAAAMAINYYDCRYLCYVRRSFVCPHRCALAGGQF